MEDKDPFFGTFAKSDDYKHQLDVWYKAYDITREKSDLFFDFLDTLYTLIDDTFLCADVLINEADQKNHFTWCWDKSIDLLSKERIHINKRGIHYEYFWNFFLETFYFLHLDGEEIKIKEYIYKLFDTNHRKTRSELDVLTEIYKLLEKNLTK